MYGSFALGLEVFVVLDVAEFQVKENINELWILNNNGIPVSPVILQFL